MTKNMGARRIINLHTRGGVFLLFPFILLGSGAISINLTPTDNTNLLNIRKPGIFFSISPIYEFTNIINIHYDGALSIINFIPKNLIIENYLRVEKIIDFEGLGNKNTISVNAYNFYPTSFSIYRMCDLSLSDSLNLYIKDRYLLTPDFKLKYKYFFSDSITDYSEIAIGSGIMIPLPYFFFTPYGSGGMRNTGAANTFLYTSVLELLFPLTGDFLAGFLFKHSYAGEANILSISVLNYADDPFFEYESIHQREDFQIAMHRILKDLRISAFFQAFRKNYFIVYNKTRKDNGFAININITKSIDNKILFHGGFESFHNYSSISDFDYTKNSALISIKLTF